LNNAVRFILGGAFCVALFATGCGPSQAERNAQAQQAVIQAQAASARAQAAAEKAMIAAQQASQAADHAAKAVHENTIEINRVSDHLEKLNAENSSGPTSR
jgi:hemolysin activation/secretion protein